jgi:hypothetical protein
MKTCYMCDFPSTTSEHAPPDCFFPAGHRINLITVPSCEEHNNKNSMDVEYIRNIIATSTMANGVGKLLTSKSVSSLTRSEALLNTTIDNPETATDEDGETISYKLSYKRLETVMQAIAYAIYYKDYGAQSKHSWKIYAVSLDANESFIPESMVIRLSLSRMKTIPRKTSNPKVFQYESLTEGENKILYKFIFYGGFDVYALGTS